MKTIVITNDKGGVGKSTLAALIIEWINFNGISVNLIDSDPIQTTRTWIDNCSSDGRLILNEPSDFLIVDTAGTSGAGITWLQKADIIVTPFQPHYADIKIVIDWFYNLNSRIQSKVMLVPNRYQKTNEQKEGLKQVQDMLEKENTGILLSHILNRPAIYGPLLNGSSVNFFIQHANQLFITEIRNLMNCILGDIIR